MIVAILRWGAHQRFLQGRSQGMRAARMDRLLQHSQRDRGAAAAWRGDSVGWGSARLDRACARRSRWPRCTRRSRCRRWLLRGSRNAPAAPSPGRMEGRLLRLEHVEVVRFGRQKSRLLLGTCPLSGSGGCDLRGYPITAVALTTRRPDAAADVASKSRKSPVMIHCALECARDEGARA